MSCANPVSNVCCLPSDNAYAVSDLMEWALTDLPMPWAYYLFGDEGSDNASRLDATGNNRDLTSTVLPHPARTAGFVTPWANQLASTHRLETPDATLNTLTQQWAWHQWAYLETPDADNILFIFGEGTQNQIELRQFWNGSSLIYRLQAGYYAPPNDTIPYYHHIIVDGLTAPFNQWFFLGGSFGGDLLTLAVNSDVQSIPALTTDDMDIATITDPFYIGPFTGRLGPLGIWLPDSYLTTEDIAELWAGGEGMGLRF